MKRQTLVTGLWIVLTTVSALPALAQDKEPALPSAEDAEKTTTAEAEVPSSQEVEINEDNYRQFMELKDAMRQRDIIPENVFKPGSGLQKLEKLPEESQKHLRNQLREIIVQGDPWQPGDEETEYPYTPSVAASTDPSLEKQEQEAWGELVGSYHEREAQIYENSSGSQAARGSEQGSSNSQQNGAGANGPKGQGDEGNQGQQAGQEGNPDQSDSEGTYSLNGSNDASANSTAGVSQNAMEFLQGLGQGGSGPGNGTQGDSEENGPGGNSPTPGQAKSQAQSGQAGTGGTSQNAMEFLQGLANGGETAGDGDNTNPSSVEPGGTSPIPSEGSSQAPSGQRESSESTGSTTSETPGTTQLPSTSSTEGSSQNALEFLSQTSGSSENQGENSTSSTGTGEAQSQAQADNSEEKRVVMQKDGRDDGQDTGESETPGNSQDEGQDSDSPQSPQSSDQTEPDSDMALAADTPPVSSVESDEESTVGASQNALEYLTGKSAQGEEDMDVTPDTTQPNGTLSIQDLLNAQGTGSTADSAPNQVEGQQADENIPDKDKDG